MIDYAKSSLWDRFKNKKRSRAEFYRIVDEITNDHRHLAAELWLIKQDMAKVVRDSESIKRESVQAVDECTLALHENQKLKQSNLYLLALLTEAQL